MQHDQTAMPLSLFYSYVQEDYALQQRLEIHLGHLRRQGLISDWHDHQIAAGTERMRQIDEHLESASIILLLVSPDFLASGYCYDIEMKRALERHKREEARVIPILLRPCDWLSAPFAQLQVLPQNELPVTQWSNQDAAFHAITTGLRREIEHILSSNLPREYELSEKQQNWNHLSVSRSGWKTDFLRSQGLAISKIKQWFAVFLMNSIIFSIVLSVLGWLPQDIPLIPFIKNSALGALTLGEALALITLIALLLFRRQKMQTGNQVLNQGTVSLRKSWTIVTVLTIIGLIGSSSLLSIAFVRPSWCLSSVCSLSEATTSDATKKDIDLYLIALQSPSFVIPGDPELYASSTLPKERSAQLLTQSPSSPPYRVVIGAHNVLREYNIVIEQVTLVVTQVRPIPHPLNVWDAHSPLDYHTNIYKARYTGQSSGEILLTKYASPPSSYVELAPEEADQLDVQIDSTVLVDFQFQVKVKYRVANALQPHTQVLSDVFEVIFSDKTNWYSYQLHSGHFIKTP